jgi:cytochrome c-type biogenesis protein
MTPSLPLAFAAGLLSFLSPCVLPLVPSYLAYVGGGSASRLAALRNSVLFVLGFSLIFILLGASASLLGSLLLDYRSWLIRFGGATIIAFGLMLLGLFKLPFLYRTAKSEYRGNTSTPLGATLMGMSFAIGWTPCVGPVLGAILTLAGASASLSTGTLLLAVYAAGLAIPFLLAALGLGAFKRFSNRLRPFLPWVERVSGGILVLAGTLMLSGYYTRLNTFMIRLTPAWLLERL